MAKKIDKTGGISCLGRAWTVSQCGNYSRKKPKQWYRTSPQQHKQKIGSDIQVTGSSLSQAKLTGRTWLLFHISQEIPLQRMPSARFHFAWCSAAGTALTHCCPSLGRCKSPGLAESCTDFPDSSLLSYSIPVSLQMEFIPIAKTETSNNLNVTLSVFFSSALTMAKIQAQKWQHTGKALTVQTGTQTERCLVNIQS